MDYKKFTEVNFNDKWPIKMLDHMAMQQVSQWKFWEKERLSAMYAAIRPDDVVLDIGACHGEMSVLFALWGARVILVEPAPHFWPEIKAHFDENNLLPYQCFQVLVSNETPEIIALPYNIEALDSEELVGPIASEVKSTPNITTAQMTFM